MSGLRALGFVLLLAGGAVSASTSVDADQPRTFGYSVGDRVERHVTVRSSRGLTLDEASLPTVGQHGKALELRSLDRQVFREADGGQRHELRFVYQVFLSPQAVRTLEMPPVVLNFRPAATNKDGRVESARIDAWPLTVSPLLPVDVSPRRGLGELQPDALPPLIDVAPGQQRLIACAALLALLLGYLAAVYVALPWLGRRRRPFERAWRALRATPAPTTPEQQREALRELHSALNQTAGQVLYAGGVDGFIASRPRFAPLRDDLLAFFARSQQAFFATGGGTPDAVPLGPWLSALSRRCRDIERGTA